MRVKAALTGLGLGVAAAGAMVLPATTPAQAATCPDNGWSTLDGRVGQFFNGTDINIRTGPSTACPSVGAGQPSHVVQLDCWKLGDDGFSWSHLFNATTGWQGWVRDDLLVDFGANTQC